MAAVEDIVAALQPDPAPGGAMASLVQGARDQLATQPARLAGVPPVETDPADLRSPAVQRVMDVLAAPRHVAEHIMGGLATLPQQQPASPVQHTTASPLVNITERDVDNAIGTGMAFSGGGLGIKAYHGSPHDFDAFSMDKIGTGEGAQAYGHGLYFAENPQTAQAYRDALELGKSGPGRPAYDRPESLARSVLDAVGGDPNKAVTEIQRRWESMKGLDPRFRAAGSDERFQAAIDAIESGKPMGGGRMYEANINADPEHFLNWDKPISEHSSEAQSAIQKLPDFARPLDAEEASNVTGQRLHQRLANKLGENGASAALREAGIPGIKYLDQGSRAAGEGSRNYVLFDDKLVNIARKYGMGSIAALPPAALAALGQPDPNQ